MKTKPIFYFDSATDTGIDKVPSKATVVVLDSDGAGTPKQFVKLSNSGMSATSTVADMLANTDLFKPSIKIPEGIADFGDVDLTTNAPVNGQVLKFNADSGKWIPQDDVGPTTYTAGKGLELNETTFALKDPEEFDFTADDGQTDFIISGAVHTYLGVFKNGIKVKSSDFTLSDDGTDTTVSFADGCAENDWIQLLVY